MAVLAVFFSVGFRNYVFNEKQNDLQTAAAQTRQVITAYAQGQVDYQELHDSLNILSQMTGSRIYAIRLNLETLDYEELVMDNTLLDSYLIEDLKQIMKGQDVTRKKQYSDQLASDVAFFGTPLKEQGKVTGAILLFAPLEDSYAYIMKINVTIWLSALVAVIVSGGVIYVISRRISKPLKTIAEGAEKVAAGERIEDLAVSGTDELAELTHAFNDMKNKLVMAESMREDFIASISHDLRTPLTTINGFVQGMMDGLVKQEDYPKYMSIIHQETQRLRTLTGDILEAAKLQSGGITLCKRYFSVKAFLDRTIENAGMINNDKQIHIAIECSDSLEIYADAERLQQVFVNILTNALNFTDKNGLIRISATSDQREIVFRVKDNGIGIEPKDLPLIFEKFYRGDKARRGLTGGTGLGLNIAKRLVELHNGKISAKSTPGEGTEIVMVFPA
ncbi:HAMP domain-containing histidine kinase [Dehalobacter sp. DCM]|uniref:sensor histidine kinase n=1 Tax=Dehalobacter sp. DCM TaxID=2907827 RepID=UPI003081A13C|nr:HAMP domain-containing histidine kinase [Dehalobacter sp. DCM]